MLRVTVEITGEVDEPQGLKEKLAMDFEKYGNVRIARVEPVPEEQQTLWGKSTST